MKKLNFIRVLLFVLLAPPQAAGDRVYHGKYRLIKITFPFNERHWLSKNYRPLWWFLNAVKLNWYQLYHCATSPLALEWVFCSFHHHWVLDVWYYPTSRGCISTQADLASLRALRSCTTHRIHNANKGFENAIEKETAGQKQTVSVLYEDRLVSGDTI